MRIIFRLGIALAMTFSLLPGTASAQNPEELHKQAVADFNAGRHAEARSLFDRACAGGEPEGCFNLGIMLANGLGGFPDSTRARYLFGKSCAEQRHFEACHRQAIMLAKGHGGSADLPRARSLFDRACTGGIPEACDMLKQLP